MSEKGYCVCTAIDNKYNIRKAFTIGEVYPYEEIIGGIKEVINNLKQKADYSPNEFGKYFTLVPERIKATYHGVCICIRPFEEYGQKYEFDKEYVFCLNEYEIPYIITKIGHTICEKHFFSNFMIKEFYQLNVESKAKIHINLNR